MINTAWWLNTAWMIRCGSSARAFQLARSQVKATQEKLLRELLSANAGTVFGQEHRFRDTKNIADYRSRVPVRTYDDFAPWIERIADGEQGVLTAERVELLQPTSGSSSAEKWIPYTASLRRQFQAGIQSWIYDLFATQPAVRAGRAYWSISPAMGPRRCTAGGLPIGFDNDEAYLSGIEQRLARHLLVMPSAVTQLSAGEAFRYITLLHLLAAHDLSLVSVWSPTFLTSLIANLPEWSEALIIDLRQGALNGPGMDEMPVRMRAALKPRPAPQRAAELAAIFKSSPRDEWAGAIWPRLKVLSCWTDASASLYLPALRAFFSQPELQPKGLIATEAFVTFPANSLGGMPLAVTSHFFEFVEEEQATGPFAATKLAHELETDKVYHVLVTTAGGLYRYALGDLVKVVGHAQDCPLLRFVGRSGRVSDLVGEKLSEAFVRDTLDQVFRTHGLVARFSLLYSFPDTPPSYRLALQLDRDSLGQDEVERCRNTLERLLQRNPYYRHAVEMGQLSPVQIDSIDCHGPCAWKHYETSCVASGQRPGNIKPKALHLPGDCGYVVPKSQSALVP